MSEGARMSTEDRTGTLSQKKSQISKIPRGFIATEATQSQPLGSKRMLSMAQVCGLASALGQLSASLVTAGARAIWERRPHAAGSSRTGCQGWVGAQRDGWGPEGRCWERQVLRSPLSPGLAAPPQGQTVPRLGQIRSGRCNPLAAPALVSPGRSQGAARERGRGRRAARRARGAGSARRGRPPPR